MSGATARTTPVNVPKPRGESDWTTWKVSISVTLRAARVNEHAIEGAPVPTA